MPYAGDDRGNLTTNSHAQMSSAGLTDPALHLCRLVHVVLVVVLFISC